jgi:outer membrane receptor protein involved in Fe transport
MIDIANVSSIEVVKGSPSVVYDPGASGGVVDIKTHQTHLSKGWSLSQTAAYDGGYEKSKYTTRVQGGTGRFGARFTYDNTESRDYNIKGESSKKLAIAEANFYNSLRANYIETHDLGYQSDSTTLRLGGQIGDDGRVDLDWDRWTGRDMSLIHGPSISDATIIQYDRMEYDLKALAYRKERAGNFRDVIVRYAHQTQKQMIGAQALGVRLETDQLNLSTFHTQGDWLNRMGVELIRDEAETLVYSEQDYAGLYANTELQLNQLTLFGGVRWNRWTTRQRLLADANADVAEQLLGISGITPSKTVTEPTWAIGAQYSFDERHNVSINLNSTYRSPDLMERYAFGGTLGGGLGLQPEEGEHVEFAWKYLDAQRFLSASIFYSRFKNYIWTKQVRTLKNPDGLAECIRLGFCDPENGEFNDQETEFFDIYNLYYNADKITNRGAELTFQYTLPGHDFSASASYNDIVSDDVFVRSAAYPIDMNVSYRREFDGAWQPWAKIKLQYVLDKPPVKQHLGFDPYFLMGLHAGFHSGAWRFSTGIRNLFNETYRAPYSGINGLARHAFVSLTWNMDRQE